MKSLEIQGELRHQVIAALGKTALFGALNAEQLEHVVNAAQLIECEEEESITREGDDSDSFFLLLRGEAKVMVKKNDTDIELGRLQPPDSFGEVGLLQQRTRTASVIAAVPSIVLRFEAAAFQKMFSSVPGFALASASGLARRLELLSNRIPLPTFQMETTPAAEVIGLLPFAFIQRHRVLPLSIDGNRLTIGFVDDPTTHTRSAIHNHLPGMTLHVVHIDVDLFDRALSDFGGVEDWRTAPEEAAAVTVSAPRLDALIARMNAEGASDLHLSAGHRPRWRVDGDIHEIKDAAAIGREEVLELLAPVMHERAREDFEKYKDADFGYSAPTARTRINIFRDRNGVSAALRLISIKQATFEQLGLPQAVMQRICDQPKGLILVTGATGSGKSTTLAAMIDHINQTRSCHIITMEDPIEFVHPSARSLVNQREIGVHAQSFAKAMRAALREDPDVILVGELRNAEEIALALELANTGHLVFASLHTNSAASTIDRICDIFRGDEQQQVRITLAEVLRGIVAQTLCRRVGGGRVAALDILVGNMATANLIRENKINLLANVMQTGKAEGMRTINDDLAHLVKRRLVTREEALSHAVDKKELTRRLDAPPVPASEA